MSTRASNGATNGGFSRRPALRNDRDPGDSAAERLVVLTAPAIDTLIAPASLGIRPSGRGVYLMKATLTTAVTAAVQGLINLDNGSSTNRYALQATAAGLSQINRVAGAPNTTNGAAFSDGVEFRIGMKILGDGTAYVSLNGGAVFGGGGGPTGGLINLRIGANVSGNTPMAGSIALVRILTGVVVSDADLQAMVAGL